MSWTQEHIKLTTFYMSQLFYWYIFYVPSYVESFKGLVFKCLPVVTLMVYVSLGSWKIESRRRLFLFFGLFFSALGDGFLIYESMFILGMLAFGIGHCFFQIAFGWKHLKPKIGVAVAVITICLLAFIVPKIDNTTIKYLTPIYGILISINIWRAFAAGENAIQNLAGIGFAFFAFSDFSIVWNRYYMELEYYQFQVMSTYYLAQYLIVIGGLSEKLISYVGKKRAYIKKKKKFFSF